MKKLWYAIATILGGVIGAGILGIPFAFAKAGILYGMINLAIVALLILTVYLYMGEVMLRTKGIHQLTGYAEKYLGKIGKGFMAFALIFGIYGALIAYLIGIGDIMSAWLGGNAFFYITAFFIIFSGLIYAGIKAVSKSEFIFSYLKIAVFIALAVSLIAFFKPVNLAAMQFSWKTSLLPYGVVLFSMMAFPSLPEAREILINEEKSLKKVLIISTIIPALVNGLFALFLTGALGKSIGEVAIVSLNSIGYLQFVLGFLFALLAMATAYLSLGLALHEMYEYDYKFSHNLAFFVTCIVPYVAIILGIKDFVKTLSIVGAVAGGITAILIVMMFRKAKNIGERHPEYTINKSNIINLILVLLFLAGIAYELIFVF